LYVWGEGGGEGGVETIKTWGATEARVVDQDAMHVGIVVGSVEGVLQIHLVYLHA